MEISDALYQTYGQILREELIEAMGCTEPVSLAYAGATARAILGGLPERVVLGVSGNIVKNVKSVNVPNLGGLKGLQAAVSGGIVAGDETGVLQVLAHITAEQRTQIADFLEKCPIEVHVLETGSAFEIDLTLFRAEESARIHMKDYHTNIVALEKNGVSISDTPKAESTPQAARSNRDGLTVRGILEYASLVNISEIQDLLDLQIADNMAISSEGLSHKWGACIGSVLSESRSPDLRLRCSAAAAAGSDARMSGCELPVVICSGSGNQGITTSVPVIVYARQTGCSQERLYRALVVSNLLTIHQKQYIGALSAFCGAVSAGASAGAAIAWMDTGSYEAVCHTLTNALGIASGMICDGAKPSCAAKIATAVQAGLLGYDMYRNASAFHGGEGILADEIETTIQNVGKVGREGMRETDREILRLMTC